MTRSARVYDFTIPAGGAVTVLAEGSFYRLMTAAGSIEVRRNNGSIVGPLLPGQGERAEFLSLTLTDKSGASNPGSILIGDDTFIDDRISGEVSVINGGLARSLAGGGFVGGAESPAVAGQYSHVQLWNPVGSGRRAIVSRISFGVANGGAYEIRQALSALATLAQNPTNKFLNEAASSIEVRREENVSILAASKVMERIRMVGSTWGQVRYEEPIVIPPGAGLVVFPTGVNMPVGATFEYFEVSE